MANKKHGGKAFPSDFGSPENQGMTLRDYFAAKALAGTFLARKDVGWGTPSDIAKRCYEFADAMIVERKKAAQ